MEEIIQTVVAASPAVGLIAGLNTLGFVIKQTEKIPNKMIPAILVLIGAIAYPFIADQSKVNFNVPVPWLFNAFVGLALGGLSVAGHQILTLTKKKED